MLTAARLDRVDVVQLLLDVGVSPDVGTDKGERGLHAAAYANALGAAKLLLDRGATVDPVNTEWGSTPLGAAVYAQHPRMIDLLGRVSRDIWELVSTGNLERLRELFRSEPDPEDYRRRAYTTMWLPDDEARALSRRLLLAHGADPTVETMTGVGGGSRGGSECSTSRSPRRNAGLTIGVTGYRRVEPVGRL
jgi:hypothetical protein